MCTTPWCTEYVALIAAVQRHARHALLRQVGAGAFKRAKKVKYRSANAWKLVHYRAKFLIVFERKKPIAL